MTTDPAPADLAGLPDDRAEERAWELAHDLFGYPPPKPRKCLGCGLRAEIFHDGACWLCVHTGVWQLVKRHTLPHEWRRLANGEG